jgi:hypothetical protein
LSDHEREDRRYALTDLIDDLAGCQDEDELVLIGARMMTSAMELALLERRCWLGTGKWLFRRLVAVAPQLACEVVAAYRCLVAGGDPRRLAEVVRRVLAESGGPLAEGYRRAGDPTS